MRNRKTKKINIFLSLALIVLVVFSQSGKAQAIDVGSVSAVDGIFGLGSPEDLLDAILEYFGMEQEQIKEYTDNADKKKTPPRVELFFSTTSPSEGEKITATASPSYFLNNPKDLYFTWFLKSADCTDRETDKSNYRYNERCNLDDNNSVDIEDYKIKAARIIANGGFLYTDDTYNTGTDNDGYEAPSGGDDQRGKNNYCYVYDNNTGEEYEIDCGSKHKGTRHLFPNFDPDDEKVTGDNDFGRDEEKFWQTDPNSNDTANRGNVDEANVAGLGILDFTWNYQKGDKVGVAVEGISIDSAPTPDSSFKTMWAMSNKTYSEKDGDIDNPSDLNDLLYDALVSPSENSAGSNKLDISLSSSPPNPINDPTGIASDTLIITSHIPNAKDITYLKYDWKVYGSQEINPAQWGDASSPLLLKTNLPESTQSVGLGIDNFKFKLALEDYNYLRILLTVTENVGDTVPRMNSQDIIVPIVSIDNADQIIAHTATVSSATNSYEVKLSLDDAICNIKPSEKAVCPVVKNQIIGLSLPEDNFRSANADFLWTIDGKPFSYSSCYFDNCNEEKQTNIAYFPILKGIGEQYTVNLTASATDGKKINLTKIFKVIEPTIEIESADETTCDKAIVGKYIDVNGIAHEDESDKDFWANICNDIKLKATPSGFSALPTNYAWDVDGNTINTSNASNFGFILDTNGILTLPPKETLGESYTVKVTTLYTQDNIVKKALKNIWSVDYNQFYEKIVSDDATITMQNDPNAVVGQGATKKIFASIYSSAPAYLAFLLRIILTISLILFTTKLVFSFSPAINQEEEN